MSRIRSSGTKVELKYKDRFSGQEYQPEGLFGKPDFVDWKNKTVIFIDGCFWHKCPIHWNEPKSNKKYWIPKLERNAVRDKEVKLAYQNSGWKVVRMWEHELKN